MFRYLRVAVLVSISAWHADVLGHGWRLKQPETFCLIDLMLVKRVVLLRDFKEG